MRFTFLFSLILCASSLFAQPHYNWANKVGSNGNDAVYGLHSNSNGDVYIAGGFQNNPDMDPGTGTYTLTSAGSNDIFFAKYTSGGSLAWANRIGSTSDDYALDLVSDDNDNIYIAGYFQGTVDFDPSATIVNRTSAGSSDIFVAKFDPNGNFLWVVTAGATGIDAVRSVAVDGSGNVAITGNFTGTVDFDPSAANGLETSAGNDDIFVAKYNSAGSYLWSEQIGGSSNDRGQSVKFSPNGEVYVTGYLNLAAIDRIFVYKYNSSGVSQWNFFLPITGGNAYGFDMALDSVSNLYLTGTFAGLVDFDPGTTIHNLSASSGGTDAFVAKYDASSAFVWAGQINSSGNDVGRRILLDNQGYFYLGGGFELSANFDLTGTNTYTRSSLGLKDAFIAKYDTSGQFFWVGSMGSSADDYTYNMTLGISGHIYAAGYFNGTADFDPSSNQATLSSSATDGFFASYNVCDINSTITLSGTTLSVATAVGATYQWLDCNNGNAPIANETNLSFTPTVNGTYAVEIHVAGCSAISSCTPVTICNIDNNVTLNNGTLTATAAGITYQWVDCNSGTPVSGQSGQSFTPSQSGLYAVSLVDGNCNATSACVSVTVCNLNTNVTLAGTTLTAVGTGTYQWVDCNNGNAPIVNETNASFTPSVSGNYAVEISDAGCFATSSCFQITIVGIETTALNKEINLYPNPANGAFNLDLGANFNNIDIQIIDLQGRRVHSFQTQQQQLLKIQWNAAPGVYALHIIADGQSSVLKLVQE